MLRRCVSVVRSLGNCSPTSQRSLHVQAGRFNSVVVRPDATRFQADEAAALADVVAKSKAESRNSVWFHCGPGDGELIKAAAALGMEFHHAEGRELAMLMWLQPSKSMVPPFATTHVGLGGVCVDPSERILVVKEDGQYRATGWKFPGGLSDLGEDFGTAAAREVLEETGVRAEFRSILAIRHQHSMVYGRSDIFALCRLHPTTLDITLDPQEITECRWMDVGEFVAQCTHPLSKFAATVALHEVRLEAGKPSTLQAGSMPAPATHTGAGAAAASPPPVRGTLVHERVFIPVTQRWVEVYRSADGPSVASFLDPALLPQADSAAGQLL